MYQNTESQAGEQKCDTRTIIPRSQIRFLKKSLSEGKTLTESIDSMNHYRSGLFQPTLVVADVIQYLRNWGDDILTTAESKFLQQNSRTVKSVNKSRARRGKSPLRVDLVSVLRHKTASSLPVKREKDVVMLYKHGFLFDDGDVERAENALRSATNKRRKRKEKRFIQYRLKDKERSVLRTQQRNMSSRYEIVHTQSGSEELCGNLSDTSGISHLVTGLGSDVEGYLESSDDEILDVSMDYDVKDSHAHVSDEACSQIIQLIKDLFASGSEYFRGILSFFRREGWKLGTLTDIAISLGVLVYQLYRARNKEDVGISLISFAHGVGILKSDGFVEIASLIWQEISSHVISQTFLENLSDVRGCCDLILGSTVVYLLTNFFAKVVNYGLFKDFCLPPFMASITRAATGIVGLFGNFADLCVYFVRCYDDLREGKPLLETIFMKDPVYEVIHELRRIRNDAELNIVTAGRTNSYSLGLRDFVHRVQETFRNCDAIMASLSKDDVRYKKLDQEIKLTYRSTKPLESQFKSLNRVPPLGLVIVGDPGIGKSLILELVYRVYKHVRGIPMDENVVFTRGASDFWEGYSLDCEIIHYSEVGNVARHIVERTGDPRLAEINSLIDGRPFPVNMAFDSKGKLYAVPGMVSIDTNNELLGADACMDNCSAILRRFLFIHVAVKSQYRLSGSNSIDPELVKQAKVGMFEPYTFQVYTRPHGTDRHKPGSKRFLLRGGDVHKLKEVLVGYMRQYFLDHNDRLEDLQRQITQVLHADFDTSDVEEVKSECFVSSYDQAEIQSRSMSRYLDMCNLAKSLGKYCVPLYPVPTCISDYAAGILSDYANVSHVPVDSTCLQYLFPTYSKWLGNKHLVNMWRLFMLFSCVLVLTSPIMGCACAIMLCFLACLYQVIQICFVWYVRFCIVRRNVNNIIVYSRDTIWFAMKLSMVAFSLMALRRALRTVKALAQGNTISTKEEELPPRMDARSIDDICNSVSTVRRVKLNRQDQMWNVRINESFVPLDKNDFDKFVTFVCRNTRHVRVYIRRDGKEIVAGQYAYGLFGNVLAINSHALVGAYKLRYSTVRQDEVGQEVYHEVQLSKDNMCELGGDLSIVLVVTNFVDMRRHIHPGNRSVVGGGAIGGSRVFVTSSEPVQLDTTGVVLHDAYKYEFKSERGDCGKPLCVQSTGGNVILGIHAAGSRDGTTGFSLSFSQRALERADEFYRANSILISKGKLSVTTVDPHSKSSFRWVPTPSVEYYGTIDNVSVFAKGKSKLRKTDLHDMIPYIMSCALDVTLSEEYLPPPMQDFWRDGVYCSPKNIALTKIGKTGPCVDGKALRKATRRLTNFIDQLVGDRKLHPLPFDEAINGADHDYYVKSLNFSTSCGFPECSPKRGFFVEQKGGDRYDMGKILERRVSDLVACYMAGISGRPVFGAQYKDEPRLREKVEIGKTRVFYMTPLPLLILARKMFVPLYTVLIEKNIESGTAVGIDMHREAARIYDYLTEYGTNIMEGDYSGYDQSFPAEISIAAGQVVHDVLKKHYNDTSMAIVRGLITDNILVHVELFGDLFCAAGLQPSGKYGTAEDNSIRGLLLLLYAWYIDPMNDGKDFFDFCRPVTYGDDVLVSVRDEVAPRFNNCTYQRVIESIGMGYTTPGKEVVMPSFVMPSNMTFLRRTFHKVDDGRKWCARLSPDSIAKSLMWYLPSRAAVTPFEQFLETVRSALREVENGWGLTEAQKMRENLILEICATYDVRDNVVREKIPQVGDLLSEFEC